MRHPANRSVELGTATTDATGALSLQVTIPSTLPPGEHTVVALGVAPDGTTRAIKLAGTTTATGGLAVTGRDVVGLAAAALLSRRGADRFGRRRRLPA